MNGCRDQRAQWATLREPLPAVPRQLALSIVTGMDTGRMRLNARKHGTRIISDRKAETRPAYEIAKEGDCIVCDDVCDNRSVYMRLRKSDIAGEYRGATACQDASLEFWEAVARCRGEETSSEVKSVLEQDERRHVAGKGN